MTPRELIPLLDSGMVEELTMYYNGRKTIIDIRHVPALPDFQIAKMWNSESGKGISVLLADNVDNSDKALHINLFYGKSGEGWYVFDGEYGYIEVTNVIAWQPLPEPYKKDGTE